VTQEKRWTVPYALASLWIVTTVALAGWWLVFGLSQARQLQALGGETAAELGRVQRMLVWEGSVLLLLLLGGGVALLVAIRREQARRRQLQDFFSLFTHDLKTALASLQLQAESLQEDLGPTAGGASLQRLMRDAVRLRLQLENSLYYAQPDAGLFIERIPVREAIEQLAADWPDMAVTCQGNASIHADRRAFEGITRNILQNAAVHGQASAIAVSITRQQPSVTIGFKDNGSGASPKALRAIAESERRPTATSGTGLGLLISRRLLERMHGTLTVAAAPHGGVIVSITLPEAA
jgi:signal transduction histidine kinase